jgi:hypothetical protein
MFISTRTLAILTALVALSGTAAADAATRTAPDGMWAPPARSATTMSAKTTRGPGTIRPIKTTTTVVAITAFPTGGKGSGSEATCELWGDRLQADEDAQQTADDRQDIIDATNDLNEDVDNALDAGCAVIYSAAAPTGNHLDGLKTIAVTRALSGPGMVQTTWTPGPQVAYISAFPTGGKGSGTEATCGLWSERLQDDQAIIDNAPDTDKQDAAGPLEQDVDNALDAGCVVIY